MKNVVLYVRVSTDEQAKTGYSLRDQEEKLRNYCIANDYNILEVYREDYSAKTFNRPEFKRLKAFCKKKSNKVEMVLFTKWDRFSRNAGDSYQVIKEFTKLGISLHSTELPIDSKVPESDIILSLYLTLAEVDNKRRSLNVTAGIRKAYKEGRYVSSAPKGYDNRKDAQKKSILVQNSDASLIREAFEMIASGIYNQKEVLERLKSKGLSISKSSLARVLRNTLYYGGIYLKATEDEPARIVDGIHEPIITKKLFDDVQKVLNPNGQLKVKHKKINPKFALKDFLVCPECNKPMKASTSKGRNNYYSYYHCSSPCKTRYKAENAEAWFLEFLANISLDKNMQELVLEIIKDKFKAMKNQSPVGPKHYQRKIQLNEKLDKARDLYLDGEFTKEEYHSSKDKIQNELKELEEKEKNSQRLDEIASIYEQGIQKLQKLDNEFIISDINDKRRLIGSIIEKKFQFENEKVRTEDINPVLSMIASVNKGYRENKKGTNQLKSDLSRVVQKAVVQRGKNALASIW